MPRAHTTRRTVAVVGGGTGGTLVAEHLLRAAGARPLRIILLDAEPQPELSDALTEAHRQAPRSAALDRRRAEVTDVAPDATGRVRVTLVDGERLVADDVVLATGAGPDASLLGPGYQLDDAGRVLDHERRPAPGLWALPAGAPDERAKRAGALSILLSVPAAAAVA